jgi:hypothetical protein
MRLSQFQAWKVTNGPLETCQQARCAESMLPLLTQKELEASEESIEMIWFLHLIPQSSDCKGAAVPPCSVFTAGCLTRPMMPNLFCYSLAEDLKAPTDQ